MTKFTATALATAAEEYSQNCTEEQNKTRKENGRRTNVVHVFEEEDAAMFLTGAHDNDPESQTQRSPFAYA